MNIEITPEYLVSQGLSPNFCERFWARVHKIEGGCWLWLGAKNNDGYGYIGRGGKGNTSTISTHRAAWIITNGPIPDGLEIMHQCPGSRGREDCVNPAHMKLGTHHENMLEASAIDKAAGRPHWNARLNTAAIKEIRDLFAAGGITKKAIAAKFGVDPSHVSRIISGDRHTRIC